MQVSAAPNISTDNRAAVRSELLKALSYKYRHEDLPPIHLVFLLVVQ